MDVNLKQILARRASGQVRFVIWLVCDKDARDEGLGRRS